MSDDWLNELDPPALFQPKVRKARYHRLTLHSGHILEIGWHFGRQKYCVSIYHPDQAKDEDFWMPHQFFGDSPREVLSGARLGISEIANPDVAKVRRRIQGDGLTYQSLRQMMKVVTMGTRYGVDAQKLFVSQKTADQLKLNGRDFPVIIVDELTDDSSIFAINQAPKK